MTSSASEVHRVIGSRVYIPQIDYSQPVNFVQLDISHLREPYLFFGLSPDDSWNHRKVLVDALRIVGLRPFWSRDIAGLPVPSRHGDGYYVKGMGLAVVSFKLKSIAATDKVVGDYSIGIDRPHLEDIVRTKMPRWVLEIKDVL